MAFKVPDDTENDIEPGNVDEHWMRKVKDWGNQIHQSMKIKVDYPSLHKDQKMPILDLKVWIKERKENQKIVVHEYYYKEVATKTMLHARAAMPHSMKRTTLTQELLRVMLRCSPELGWEAIIPHLDHTMLRMQYSGYSKQFRAETLKSAINAYKEIMRKDSDGTQPMYRDKSWNKDVREIEKRRKKGGWFKKGGNESVIFIPTTPGSTLKKKYQAIIKKSKMKIKVVERAGTTLKQHLQRSNPLGDNKCLDKNHFPYMYRR